MRKVAKAEKDLCPSVYGYSSPDQVKGNWIPYLDADKDLRFIPCSFEFFIAYSNERSREKEAIKYSQRCLIPSKRYNGYVRCRENCDNCPFHKEQKEGQALSLEKFEEDGYEIPQYEVNHLEEIMDLRNIISLLSEQDQEILRLVSEGESDSYIANQLHKTRECIKKRRQRLYAHIKSKLQDND